MPDRSIAIAFEAQARTVEGFESGEPREQTLRALVKIGIPTETAGRFYDQMRTSWESKRRALELVASGRRFLWIGAMGLGIGASLLLGILKAIRVTSTTGVPERMLLLPLLVLAISIVVTFMGCWRFVLARRKPPKDPPGVPAGA